MILAFLAALAVPQADREAAVKDSLGEFAKALASGDKEKVVARFDLDRMLQEFQARSALPLAADEAGRKALLAGLKAGLPNLAAGFAGATWDRIRPLSVRIGASGKEAETLCQVVLGGEKARFRFWLVAEKDDWKVYDFEMLDAGIRLSLLMSTLFANALGDGEAARRLQRGMTLLQKAILQMTQGETDEARENLIKVRATKPPPEIAAWVEFIDASLLLLEGEDEEALKAADKALALHKDLALAWQVKAAALTSLERHEDSIAASKEFLRLVGDDSETWLAIGESWEELDKVDEAIAAYRKGVAADDEEHENRMALAKLLLKDGKADEADGLLAAAVKNAAIDEGIFEEAAELLFEAGRHAPVLALAQEHAKRAPEDASPFRWQGLALRRLARHDESERALRRAIELDGDDAELLGELARTLALAGKEKEAGELADKYAEEDECGAHLVRAFIHAVAKRTEQAVEELRLALGIDPDQVEAVEKEPAFEALRKDEKAKQLISAARAKVEYRTKAGELVEEKDWEGLLKLSRERVAAAPADWDALHDQGTALRRLGKAAEAEPLLRQGLEKDAENRERWRDSLGRALAAQGRVDAALDQAAKLKEESENPLDALHLRAAIYAIARKPAEGLKALKELLAEDADQRYFLEEDPDFEDFLKLPEAQKLLKESKEE
jgi:tetratricopeptide (TPR) repeat protein